MESIPFEIAHCSSFEQDFEPDHLIGELNQKNRGWQTKKCPEYPQDLILQFKAGLCRIFKIEILSHHYKIASQVEFYAGVMKEQEQDAMYIQFNRLGFVSLNNSNRFQDRELKSVKVQADCEYVRLVVKGCYENRLNVHKQVGFLGLNIMGHSIASIEQPKLLYQPPIPTKSPVLQSVTDDFNLEHWIQVIQNAEEEAAQDEDFKEAKIYKELGDRLTGLWRFLINLESDKQQAILTKDYDEAEKIKADMIQVKCTVETLLRQSGIQITREGDILPYENGEDVYHQEEDELYPKEEEEEDEEDMIKNDIPDLHTLSNSPNKLNHTTQQKKEHHPDQLLDEAIANWTSFDALSIHPVGNEITSSPSLLSARIPIQPPSSTTDKPSRQPKQEDPGLSPEPLTVDDLESCELAIQKFGQGLVAMIMSVKIKCRQYGLDQLAQLIEQQEDYDLEFIQASILMIQEAIVDSREIIFHQAICCWKSLYELCQQQMATLDDDYQARQITSAIEKFFSRVLMRTSDSNPGIKSSATKTILELIGFEQNLIALCFKDRMIRNLKDAKARLELVMLITKKSLVPAWKSDPSVFRQHVMKFIVSYLKNHPHADIRQSTWDLLVLVAQHQLRDEADFKAICVFLENDTIRLLQQELRKNEKKLKSTTSSTVKELRSLAVKSSTTTKKTKPTGDKRSTATKKTKTKTQPKPVVEEEEEKTNVCIFCDKVDDAFNEDTLISHYYTSCPVLTNCPMCQIILEVSTLKEHLELDCEKKHLVKQCNQCKTSIPVEQWLQHTSKKTCTVTADDQSRCPFCQLDMTKSNEKGWKAHLINKCPKNPRRRQK
ncbi:hypothetical protein EDC96DRAFT_567082 [Choanephora cucurbitarum]|nr:hypothetical protein EDC96DRAFT_567082 [Choanephora cucurbitarum]